MKKALIAGAASAVLAVLPAAGVFAAETTTTATDNIRLVVSPSCTMTSVPDSGNPAGTPIDLGNFTVDQTTGDDGSSLEAKSGVVMTLSCNNESGWDLSAQATALTSGTNNEYTIPFGGWDASSDNSMWTASIAVSNSSDVTVTSGWADGTQAATTANNTIVEDKLDASSKPTPISGLTVTPTYKAHIGKTQKSGTYNGTITYTFTADAAN